MLLKQLAVIDGHAAVHGLAHVVNGQQRHLQGGEGFHLDAGGAHGFDPGSTTHGGGLIGSGLSNDSNCFYK